MYTYNSIFCYFKRTKFLRKYKENIIFYKRAIDDVLGTLIRTPYNPNVWGKFKANVYNTCKLKWTFISTCTSVVFLNLTIEIKGGVISTYAPIKNLRIHSSTYLQIPPTLQAL